MPHTPPMILAAEADPDARDLIRKAFEAARPGTHLRFVSDGTELVDYLFRRGTYSDPARSPRPALVLTELDLPGKEGREALREIRSDPALRVLRVVVLSRSRPPAEVATVYAAGAASFVAKPESFANLVEVAETLGKYWLDVVELPPGRG